MWPVKTILLIHFCGLCQCLYSIRNDYKRKLNYTRPEDETAFHLYSRGFNKGLKFSFETSTDLSKDDQLFIGNINSIQQSRFNSSLPTKLIIHGWTHGKDIPWVIEMREAMARTNSWNVIVVDWSPLSHAIYSEARIHANVVGKQVSRFCMFLVRTTGVQLDSIHLIGHSMGAQISSSAGHQVQVETGKSFGRITGLDPAAPLYEWPHVESLDEMLDPSDANFVDVIHTNGKHLGIIFPSGHVDYYPNGGQHQPGCNFWVCSHIKSCEFWIASIKNPYLFKAYPFNSWDEFLKGKIDETVAVPMGIAAGPDVPIGSYFLETSDEEKAYLQTKTTILDSF